jgi:hypothetical protein
MTNNCFNPYVRKILDVVNAAFAQFERIEQTIGKR